MLNSFWGKYCQKSNQPTRTLFNKMEEFHACVFDRTNAIMSVQVLTEEVVSVTYRKIEGCEPRAYNTNPVVGSFVTCYGRLRLHSLLMKLGRRCLYFDTDSAYYTVDRLTGEPNIPYDTFLGDFTSELGAREEIVEFVAAGPKNYSYRKRNIDTGFETIVQRIRGFTLSFAASQVVTHARLKEEVFKFVEENICNVIPVPCMQIRKTNDFRITTNVGYKNYSVCYSKRAVCADFSTLPFGF